MKEEEKYQIIKELVDHNGNKKRAALKLHLTIRQINRLIHVYKDKGKDGFVHHNKHRQPVNSLPPELSEKIVNLYRSKYQGFNFAHFKDMLLFNEKIGISYSCLYRLLSKNGILSEKAHRSTKKEFKKKLARKLKPSASEEEIEQIVKHEIEIEDAHPRKERKKYFGEEVQMDGSIHLWFGDKKTCLHLATDNCTGIPVGGYFDEEETLHGYYHVFEQILKNYGIPYCFKTDNRTVFNYVKEVFKKDHDDVLTQFGYACRQLGVSIVTTSVSQAKGQIERANGTFQGRLVNELKLHNIHDIESANDYLINVFIPFYRTRFCLNKDDFESVFESSPDQKKINQILAIISPRKFDNGSCIKYMNHYYQVYDEDDNLKCFMPKTECLVIKAYDDSLYVSVDEKVYALKPYQKHESFSSEFDKPKEDGRKNKNYIPPMSHPWKRASFIAHQLNAHKNHIYA